MEGERSESFFGIGARETRSIQRRRTKLAGGSANPQNLVLF